MDGTHGEGSSHCDLLHLHSAALCQYYRDLQHPLVGKLDRGYAQGYRILRGHQVLRKGIRRHTAHRDPRGHQTQEGRHETGHAEAHGPAPGIPARGSRIRDSSFGGQPGKVFQAGLLQRQPGILSTSQQPGTFLYPLLCQEQFGEDQPAV